jgi:hypothetical protein
VLADAVAQKLLRAEGEEVAVAAAKRTLAGPTWDRCYDFLNIFAEKFSEKMAFSTKNKAKLCKNLIITLVFEKNANFSPKIVENRRKL